MIKQPLLIVVLLLLSVTAYCATITTTIGSDGGRDYSTVTLWEDDLDNAGVYASDDYAVGELYDDSNFSTPATIVINGGGTIGLIGRTLTVEAGERHSGTAGSGVEFEGDYEFDLDIADTIVEWIEFDGEGGSIDEAFDLIATAHNQVVRNTIIHDFEGADTKQQAIKFRGNDDILNNIIYDIKCTNAAALGAVGIQQNTDGSGEVYNNTVERVVNDNGTGLAMGFNFLVNVASNIKNNYSSVSGTSSGTKYTFILGASQVHDYNISSNAQATGANSYINIPATSEFTSLTDGSENYHLKAGCVASNTGVDVGTSPDGVEIDIDGEDRDDLGVTWDITADEATLTRRVIRSQ